MKVLFVYTVPDAPPRPAKPLSSWKQLQFGISYISSALKSAGHQTELFIARPAGFDTEIANTIQSFSPDIACFTAVATEHPFVAEVAQALRRISPQTFRVIGGPHASLQPHDVLDGPFDAVCVGEGERAVVELAHCLELGNQPTKIPNLWIKRDTIREKNGPRPFAEDLDSFDFPDREMWRPLVNPNPAHSILIGRGCPFQCAYCCNHALKELSDGRYVRLRSAQNVVKEVDYLCESFPDVSEVYFEVEALTAKRKWVAEFSGLLEEFNATKEKPLVFGTNIRVTRNHSFKNVFELLRKANFAYVNIGIESGSERIRKDVLKRNYSNEDLIRTFDEAHDAGLKAFAYNMIGLPGETSADFLETIRINRLCKPERSLLSIFYPYPGTELHRICVERGLDVCSEEATLERSRATLGLPEFPNKLIDHYFIWFDWYAFRGQKPLLKILSNAALKALRGHPKLYRLYKLASSRGPLASLKQSLR